MLGRVVLGRYRVITPLAHGGMGVVYLGRTEGAEGFSRPVVIKRVLPELVLDQNIAKMFVREAKILSNLHHPGIVGVVDFGEEDGAYIMVLDYVHGYDASAWLLYLRRNERRVPVLIAVQIAIRVLEALHYAHTLRRPDGTPLTVVHRDVSPGNVLLDTEGRVRLLDFGIARISEEANEYRTQETTFKGKLGYAHPSLLARGEPTPQTDVYSTAVVLFQMLAGKNPFRGTSTADTLSRIVNLPLPRLGEYLSDVDPKLENILLRSMSRDLAFGYADAETMAEALRKFRGGSDTAISAEMAELFSADFLGDLPASLDLQHLEERDAAWRTSVVDGSPGSLRSTPPRPSEGPEPPTLFAGSNTGTIIDSDIGRREPRAKSGSGQKLIALAIAGVALALVVVAVVMLRQQEHSTPEARYVVVSQSEQRAAQPTEPVATAESQAAPAGSEPVESATSHVEPTSNADTRPHIRPAPARASGSAQKPSAQLLTQRFSVHQGRIQSCFTRNAEEAKRTTSVQISFQVSESGAVQSASLIPSGLGSTALGQCILGVARSAKFGALTEPAAFRIPVQARIR
jgi:serine/threonine-protein kinase